MCGLVGILGSINTKEEKVFRDMLVVDSLRGPHSTGAAFLKADCNGKLIKTVGNPWDLMELAGYYEGMKQFNKCLLGHNRFATIGSISRNNAHPFNFKNLIGMHNGTIRNKEVLENHDSFGTDSEAIFNSLNQFDMKEIIAGLVGAWALVWVDKEYKTLNFLRNKERELYYTMSKDSRNLFFASEAGILRFALDRNEIEYGSIKLIDEDTHYSFDVPNSYGEIKEPEITRGVKGKPSLPLVVANKPMQSGGRGSSGSTSKISYLPHYHGPYTTPTSSKKPEVIQGFYAYFDINKKCNRWRIGKKTPGPLDENLRGEFVTQEAAYKAIKSFLEVKPQEPDDSISDLTGPMSGDRWVAQSGPAWDMVDENSGEFVPQSVYEELTEDGCATCGEPFHYSFDNVTWLNETICICEQCYDDIKEMNGNTFNPTQALSMLN